MLVPGLCAASRRDEHPHGRAGVPAGSVSERTSPLGEVLGEQLQGFLVDGTEPLDAGSAGANAEHVEGLPGTTLGVLGDAAGAGELPELRGEVDDELGALEVAGEQLLPARDTPR